MTLNKVRILALAVTVTLSHIAVATQIESPITDSKPSVESISLNSSMPAKHFSPSSLPVDLEDIKVSLDEQQTKDMVTEFTIPDPEGIVDRFKGGVCHTGNDFLDGCIDLSDIDKIYAEAPLPSEIEQANTTLGPDGGVINIPEPILTTSRYFEAEKSEAEDEDTPADPESYIPAGTMLKGVLLSGLDAPTGFNAKNDPFPVLVRIQEYAILPNLYRSNVKGCFLLMTGYGHLSSERVMLHGETFSCIKDDGSIIQARMPSYVTDEEGKAGLCGHLVSTTGNEFAKIIFKVFTSYLSKVFQRVDISGDSKALEPLLDYYINIADEMFPIIKIDRGREVTVIVTKGTPLTVVRDGRGKILGGDNE